MSVSLSMTLDTRRLKQKTGTYPVKLLAVYNSKPQRYQTVYDLTQENYDKLSANRINSELQNVRDNLKEGLRLAENAAKLIQPFSFDRFEKNFISKHPLFKKRKQKVAKQKITTENEEFDFAPYEKKFPILKEEHPFNDSISVIFLWYVKALIEEERIGSALNYQHTYNSLKKFKGNVRFVDITPSYLRQYEKWMLDKDRSRSTVGINLRPLRAIVNLAIDKFKIMAREDYPFGRWKYLIPTSKNVKKVVAEDDISKIYYYETDNEFHTAARDYWLFCFFANGMNPKDVALLRYKNIQDEYIIFERAKTQLRTRNDPKPITVYLSEDLKDIIRMYGNKDHSPSNFIFPILNSDMSPLEQHFAVRKFVKSINDGMSFVCADLEIKRKTTIFGRHSFSTMMKRAGASTEFIQESLGHSDKKTTENYLDSFEKETKKEFANKLVQFKARAKQGEPA